MPLSKLKPPHIRAKLVLPDGSIAPEWYRWAVDVSRLINEGGGGGGITTEEAVDAVAAALAAGTHTNITVSYNDAGDAISLSGSAGSSYTDEQAQDAVAAAIAAGTHSGVSVAYNDAANSLSFTNTSPGGGATGTTVLLLLLNGTNGSTTFTDSSPYNKSVTAVGSAALSTTQKRFGSASLYVDGSGARASVAYDETLTMGASNFTVQCSFYLETSNVSRTILTQSSGVGLGGFTISTNASGALRIFVGGANNSQILSYTGSAVSLNTWVDVAITRNGSTLQAWVNGTSVATATSTVSGLLSIVNVTIGANSDGSSPMIGYIDHIRIKKGEAVAISALTTEFTS